MDCALYLLDKAELADGVRGNPVLIIRTIVARVRYLIIAIELSDCQQKVNIKCST